MIGAYIRFRRFRTVAMFVRAPGITGELKKAGWNFRGEA